MVAGGKGAIVHPSGALNTRDNNNFQPRIGLAWHARSKLVIRSGFAVNTVDVKFPSLRAQFDEYVGQVNLQRAPGDPRQLFQISSGPGSFSLPVRNNRYRWFRRHQLQRPQHRLVGPEPPQPLRPQLADQHPVSGFARTTWWKGLTRDPRE